MRAQLPAIVIVALCCMRLAAQDVVSVASPDGRIQFRLIQGPPAESEGHNQPRLSYQIDFQGKRLIDTSYLGFEILDQLPFGDKLGLINTIPVSKDETYTLVAGKAKTIRNHYNGVTAEYLQNGSVGRRMSMEVRAFDDGVAFRYFIPQVAALETMKIVQEGTQFAFAQDAESYPLIVRDYQTGYEDQYSKLTLSAIHPDSLIALPFLVQQPGVGWVAITEADVDEYPGMYVSHVDGARNPQTFRAQLSPMLDGSGLVLSDRTPVASPWRVFLINDNPAKLLESNIVTSLNAPSKIADTSWIKPGKSISDASMRPSERNTASIKRDVDFAASGGLQYVTLSEGWSAPGAGNTPDLTKPIPSLDMPAILAYAKQKNIGIWLWAPWKSVDSQMEQAFTLYEKWGVKGVVVDGMNRDDVWMVNFYRRVAQAAATHHLMLDFHGAFKPDGMNRTFPNLLTREAVLGSEYNKSTAQVTPDHDVMLAYTRLLAGSMDYAPGGFGNVTREQFHPSEKKTMTLGTRPHALALFTIFESPLQTLADEPDAYGDQTDYDAISPVPATWDETVGVAGEVGDYIAVARRQGSDWYLGAITNWTPREVSLPLSFLGAGNFTAEIYADADDSATTPTHTKATKQQVNRSSTLKIKLAPGGGVEMRIRPVDTKR